MLSRVHLQAIQKLIKSSKQQANNTQTWRDICELENIGQPTGKYIVFTSKEMQQLRMLIDRSYGIDLQEQSLEGNRTDITAVVNNEKLSNEPPFASALLLATRSKVGIPCLARCYECPPKGFIGLHLNDLNALLINKLVVVENGRAFIDWHLFNFPPELDDAILIYRGHGSNVTAVAKLLSSMPVTSNKIGFFDYDPAGIAIANSTGVEAIIVPDLQQESLISAVNKPSSIARQQDKIGRGYITFNPILKNLYKHLIARNLAVTQEAMAKYQVRLNLLSLSSGDDC